MNIAIIGLGYVGVVTGTCLSSIDHNVFGCDISKKKTELLRNGVVPFLESGCDVLLNDGLANKTFEVSTDIKSMLTKSDIVFICVGTPSDVGGCVDLSFLDNVLAQIGEFILETNRWVGVCLRSTVPVGTMQNTVIPVLESKSGKRVKDDFGVAFCPEFLREGNAVNDFLYPPITVISSSDGRMRSNMEQLWKTLPGDFEILNVRFEEAEMCKYAANAFHALKISFANEIGLLSKNLGADGNKVMEILISDTSLNISPKYLKPGFAFGGSCLPKDLRALESMGKQSETKTPLLNSILSSNESIIESSAEMILKDAKGVLGFAGITFKDGTDDLRESSVIKLIYRLYEHGKEIVIYDRHVNPEIFTGVNLALWNELITRVKPIFKTDVSEFCNIVDTIIINGEQTEIRDYIQNTEMSKLVFNLG